MMEQLTVRAYERQGGRTAELTLLEAKLSATTQSPALSLWASFACEKPPGELGDIEALIDSDYRFMGKVDRQRVALTERGMQVEVEARSSGALLLDNEARPHTYADVSLATIFNRHIAPYGFSLEGEVSGRRLALYTVPKGASEWEALTGWAARAVVGEPRVHGNMVTLEPLRPTGMLTVSNGSGGIPFTRLTLVHSPYDVISQVILRDEEGNYRSGVEHSHASDRGIRRKRYRIPATEFEDSGRPDADRYLRRSMEDFLKAEVTLPGLIAVGLGWHVAVQEPGWERYYLTVREWVYETGPSGTFTRLELGATWS